MKTQTVSLLALLLGSCWLHIHAQMGPSSGGLGGPLGGHILTGAMLQLFGDNKAFTAGLEMQVKSGPSGGLMILPGRMAYLDGNSRLELDLSSAKGGAMPPDAAAQIKQIGMDKMVVLAKPDRKAVYLVYPGMQAYAEQAIRDADLPSPASDTKVETTDLGKETLNSHECVKQKVIVTGKDGKPRTFTVWNASDLNKFPLKMETTEEGTAVVILFKDVKLAKPAAASFDPPSGFTKYDNVQTMIQQVMMKKLGAGMGGQR